MHSQMTAQMDAQMSPQMVPQRHPQNQPQGHPQISSQMHPQSRPRNGLYGFRTKGLYGFLTRGLYGFRTKDLYGFRFYKPRCSNLPCTDSVQSPNPKNRHLSAICSLLVPADVRNPYATIWTPMIFKNSPPALMTLRPSQNGRAGVAQDLPRQPSRTLPGNPRMDPKARLQMHPQNKNQKDLLIESQMISQIHPQLHQKCKPKGAVK